MSQEVLFESDGHRNVMLEELEAGEAVPCNQHILVDGNEAMILDPGGSKLFRPVFERTAKVTKGAKLKHIFLSHQDPDIVAALNGWLLTAESATGWCSELWRRFIPHFGSDRLVYSRVKGIPDEGMRFPLGSSELLILPAHFLHSCGNFHVYDPTSKILYTGDLGASMGEADRIITDLGPHIERMEGFHTRYMASNQAIKLWADMVRGLDVEVIAPQHGSILKGKDVVSDFLDWITGLNVGVDALQHLYKVPAAS